ncbi:ATP-dependent nuclease [Niabella hibiscisoli]|uniref:ATP-dependent nuclease n=1 Tax=Niabella hibiscisoli TaxID=1825928 RepID=UPI001F107AA5|nr:AAA family ATPase [Niabella hibiscisoli]MCH5720180.1 ATP-binding protein [Niabella hibiscisoli]
MGGLTDFSKFKDLSTEDLVQERENVSEKVNVLLDRYYGSELGVKMKIESHNGEFSLLFKDKSNKIDLLTERSSGFQYFFTFLINKLYAKHFGKEHSIYLLDEPALSLHPKNQKRFVKLLEDVAEDNLVIYTTHSPFCINRLKPTRVWVVERALVGGTTINHKSYRDNWRPLRSSLGIDIADSFFYSDKTLLVEGPEDRIYIGALINYFVNRGKIKIHSDLFSIIDSGSIANMPAMVQILLDEGRPIFILIDNDEPKIQKRLIEKEKN